jgi:ABC-type dipeptide/oligopeptide/nickel transport system permease component
MLIAALIGAYVAGRMSGLKRKTDGVLHGVVTWAVTTLLFVFLATSAGGSLLSGLFSSLNPGAAVAQSGGVGALINRQMGTNVSPESLRTLQEHIGAGRRDQAIDYMSSSMGVKRDRAAGIVDQALILSGSPEQASPAGRDAANRALQQAGTTAWIAFGAVALSLMLSLLGGAIGAMGARRTTWTDDMESPIGARIESEKL